MLARSLRAGLAFAALALVVFPLVECNEDDTTTTLLPSTGTIGSAGGSLVSSDEAFELFVPAGALTTNVGFTITAVTPSAGPAALTLTPAYTISPAGQAFAAPVVLSFSQQVIVALAPADGGAIFHDPSDYRVAALVSNAWAPLANPSFDPLAMKIAGTATVVTGSAYSVIIPPGGSCVNVTATCSAKLDAGCASACAPSVPGKCAAYSGAVTQSCSATATSLSVSCCYPTGAPLCFSELETTGCASPCQQLPGSTTTACTASGSGPSQSTCCFSAGAPVCVANHVVGSPAPRCATSSPCAGYAGTRVGSCADVVDGTDATCCFPVGTLPTSLPTGALVDGGAVVSASDAGDAGDGG
jgi:hypothetical protein